MSDSITNEATTAALPASSRVDHDEITNHINGLFDAYFRADREAIRRGHTADWRGFPIRSRRIVRGIDAYMEAAEATLSRFQGIRHEMLDMDVQVHGDLAIVYYVAREWLRDPEGGGERTVLLRSVDIYRRDPGGWNQCGSNIIAIPDDE